MRTRRNDGFEERSVTGELAKLISCDGKGTQRDLNKWAYIEKSETYESRDQTDELRHVGSSSRLAVGGSRESRKER